MPPGIAMGGLISRSASPSSGSRADTISMGIDGDVRRAVSEAAPATRTSRAGMGPVSRVKAVSS